MEVFYRAVDKLGKTVDFLLAAHRDVAAARRFCERAIDLHDVPEKITIDKSGANTAAARGLVADSGVEVELRQCKYLNNIVEQDHRAIKFCSPARNTGQMMPTDWRCARPKHSIRSSKLKKQAYSRWSNVEQVLRGNETI